MKQPTIYNTAIYCRLSRDDGMEQDSSSIQTQKEMLTRYCHENGFTPYQLYIDDGWSGTNSDRPDFQRMLSDIEDGKINCVITKDLSRLGRNYLETGGYTEIFFPEHGVRYIAVTDGVDTAKGSTMDITPFKNLLNDMYVQDLSRKTRAAMLTKKRQGKFIGDTAPFGYEKDPADKNHLIINEEHAATVRRIFQMAKDGLGVARIANILSKEKVRRPGAVAGDNHAEFRKYVGNGNEYEWHAGTVRSILRNATYKGCIVANKTVKLSFRSKKRRPCTKDEIIVVENMHEPIIEPDEWELIQQLITSRKRANDGKYEPFDNIFCGLLRCPDCGYSFALKRSHRKYDKENYFANFDYYCNSYNSSGKRKCSTHRIIASDLYNAVLADIKRLANNALDNDKHMISSIAEKLCKAEKDSVKQAERALKKANKRLSELDRLFAKLYEEHVNGDISERNYSSLSASYEAEQTSLENKVSELREIIKTNQENGENAENFVDTIKNYAEITELSQSLLHSLIDKIEIHEPEDIDGEYVQKIDVYYKFVGKID